jgi:hypothetical protein
MFLSRQSDIPGLAALSCLSASRNPMALTRTAVERRQGVVVTTRCLDLSDVSVRRRFHFMGTVLFKPNASNV